MIRLRYLCILGLALAPGFALAQAPADHGGATSAPLFVEDLPVGTVSIRLSRPAMAEAIAGINVVGRWTVDGQQKSTRVQTGSDGRALFSDVPVGSTFQAEATVEGEHLISAPFAVPAQGGTKLLMIVGAEAAEAMTDMTGAPSTPSKAAGPQPVAVRSGNVTTKDDLPAGTVDIKVTGPDGKAVPDARVSLGHVANKTGAVEFVEAKTDASGIAHFDKREADGKTQYAAVLDRDGLRVGSDAFALDEKHGAAGELRIPARTNDLAVLRISSASRVMIELREDAVEVLQNLIVENTSDKIFDPGPDGLLIPLPDGFTGGEKLPGGADVEIKEGAGVILRGLLAPTQPAMPDIQVRIGYAMATHEARDFEIVQPMPMGMKGGLVLMPAEYTIGLSSPGLRVRPNQRDDSGNELSMFDLDAVAPGHALRLTVHGLPTHDQAGKWIAGVLVALLIVAGIVALARPRRSVGLAGKAG
jgi:hypothetical protein